MNPWGSVRDHSCLSSVVEEEDIPPLPQKTLDKIQKWECMDLATLISNVLPTEEPSTIIVSGQVLIVDSLIHQSKKLKVTLDIHS